MIVDPVTMSPDAKVSDALEVMRKYKISGVPITKNGKLVGILTNRDLRFETRFDIPISKVMTKENLITVPVGTTLEEAENILHKHRVEKLLVVDDNYNLKGLITVKDIQKKLKYPNAAKDSQGRLRVGAAIGATGDYLERAQEMVKGKVDVLAIDSAHGHSTRVLEAVKRSRQSFPKWISSPATSPLSTAPANWSKPASTPSKSASAQVRSAPRASSPALGFHRSPQLPKPTALPGRRHSDHCRRRHQVLRRHHQGHRRGRIGAS